MLKYDFTRQLRQFLKKSESMTSKCAFKIGFVTSFHDQTPATILLDICDHVSRISFSIYCHAI